MSKESTLQNRRASLQADQTSLVCIVCPRGCRLTARRAQTAAAVQGGLDASPALSGSVASPAQASALEISGNSCPRGEDYARQELTNPTRVLTALIRLQGTDKPISVKTDRPVPRDLLFTCAEEIYRTHPDAPVQRGDILIRDLCGTGANVIATRDAQTHPHL